MVGGKGSEKGEWKGNKCGAVGMSVGWWGLNRLAEALAKWNVSFLQRGDSNDVYVEDTVKSVMCRVPCPLDLARGWIILMSA